MPLDFLPWYLLTIGSHKYGLNQLIICYVLFSLNFFHIIA
jgi:hypothetical protein